jgi:cellulose synthase/poly-beta-1,6-N-acetylglucosamine synthase-like glycosyltransferase
MILLEIFTWVFIGYNIAINLGYITLNLMSIVSLVYKNQENLLHKLPQSYSEFEYPISLLVPAYNEEATIVTSIKSMLQLKYSSIEIVVINDGSKDGTLEALNTAFELQKITKSKSDLIQTQTVRGFYQSSQYPNLFVIDKKNGGKADSLNAGINFSNSPLFCAVDADSILERTALQRLAKPFMRDPQMVVSGGTIRVANGCQVSQGNLTRIGLSTNPLALLQVVEYLRAFLFGRLGWSRLNAILIVSGAFGLFKKEKIIEVGGYKTNTIGEDMELIVRLHRILRSRGEECPVEFVADSVCWTEVPEDIKTLRNQRIRWQRGLCESLYANKGLLFSKTGGAAGWVAFPFMLIFEAFGPLLEIVGYFSMFLAVVFDYISWHAFFVISASTVSIGVLLSTSALALEEFSFHTYPKMGQIIILWLVGIIDSFGYRQLNTYWRVIGLYKWVAQTEAQWGKMTRKGSWQAKS